MHMPETATGILQCKVPCSYHVSKNISVAKALLAEDGQIHKQLLIIRASYQHIVGPVSLTHSLPFLSPSKSAQRQA
jgi:hypothetical protein